LAADTLDPAGIYFGTRSGKVYGSNDEGKSWQLILEGLPPVVCVKAAVVGGSGKPTARAAKKTARKVRPKPKAVKKPAGRKVARARAK
jgi:hypothetical protein